MLMIQTDKKEDQMFSQALSAWNVRPQLGD